ncbi:MAG: M48 family metalloprotease [Nitrospira sp.]
MTMSQSLLGRLFLSVVFGTQLSCATTDLPPIKENSSFLLEEDGEKRLWSEAEAFEHKLAKSGLLFQDESLNGYLLTVLQRLLPQGIETSKLSPRIQIIRNPFLNGFAMPNGLICLNSGLLTRMETEDQLAAVIGHELIHFTHRHGLKQARDSANKEIASKVVGALFRTATVGSGYTPDIAIWWTGGWILASLQGYSRELEAEADTGSYGLITKAGYDPLQVIRLFEMLQQDLGEYKSEEPFFYGTHPMLQERIDNYRNLIGFQGPSHQSSAQTHHETLQKKLFALYLANAELDLEIGRLNAARSAIEKHLAMQPRSARAYYLLGEAHRRRGRDAADIQQALSAYQAAIDVDPKYPEPHREIGMIFRILKREDDAREEFERYLSLSSSAPDAPIIKGFMKEASSRKESR